MFTRCEVKKGSGGAFPASAGMRLIPLFLSAVLLVLPPGCTVSTGGHGEVVSVGLGHVCVGDCDHYYDGGHYYRGHRHGSGCGHVHQKGVWVVGH